MLRNLSAILESVEQQLPGQARSLPSARLAPDMFTLRQQVNLACFHACGAFGAIGPPGEAAATSLAELRTEIAQALAEIEAVDAAAFDGFEGRTINLPGPDPSLEFAFSGEAFLLRWSLPHFYFHLVTAYDILRAEGAQIGKRDYLADVAGFLRTKAPPA